MPPLSLKINKFSMRKFKQTRDYKRTRNREVTGGIFSLFFTIVVILLICNINTHTKEITDHIQVREYVHNTDTYQSNHTVTVTSASGGYELTKY